jgi:hypothetical protein
LNVGELWNCFGDARIVFNNTYVTRCCIMYKCTDTWKLLPSSSLMMESSSSECLYTCTWTTQHHIPKDRELYIYCCDSIKSYTIINEIFICIVCGNVEAVNCHKTASSYGLLYHSIFILPDNCRLSLHGTIPAFIWAVSWVNYINMLNELIGRGHWWCYAFRFFYKRIVI